MFVCSQVVVASSQEFPRNLPLSFEPLRRWVRGIGDTDVTQFPPAEISQ